jgi:hypothetical protein
MAVLHVPSAFSEDDVTAKPPVSVSGWDVLPHPAEQRGQQQAK